MSEYPIGETVELRAHRDPIPLVLALVRTAAQVLIAIGVAVIAW